MNEEIEKILKEASEQAEDYAFNTFAVEERCVIDDSGRIINLTSQARTLGVENDKAVERVYFQAPRYVGDNVGLDLSQCTVYVNYMNAAGEKDQYIVEDLNVSEDDDSQVTFSWLLSRKVTQYKGDVNFIVCARKVKTGGEIEQEWNTTLAKGNVMEGLEPGSFVIPSEDLDIVNQLIDMVKEEIDAKAANALATIPEDYSSLNDMVKADNAELLDVRVGANGKTYDSAGEAVREQVTLLIENTNNYFELVTKGETILNMNWIQGYWWAVDSGIYGVASPVQNYVACKNKIIGDGTRLIATKESGHGFTLFVCEYSSDGEFINGYQYGNTELNILLERGKQYTFSISSNFGVTPGSAVINYPFIKKINIANSRIYYIGANRELKTLKEGLKKACENKDSIVYVEEGTYDIIQEYGDEYFEKYVYSSSDCGIVLKNNVHVIFSSKAKVICNYTGNNHDVMYYFSPFNVGEKGFKLENLTIECSRVRYCVHDDLGMFGNSHEFTKTEYQNCNMYLDNSENTVRENYNCIGGGLPYNGEIVINGCVFESTATGSKYGGVDYHQNGEAGAKSKSLIANCYFKGDMDHYSCSNLGQTQEKSTIIVTNCSFGRTEGYVNNPEYSNSIEFINWNNIRRP